MGPRPGRLGGCPVEGGAAGFGSGAGPVRASAGSVHPRAGGRESRRGLDSGRGLWPGPAALPRSSLLSLGRSAGLRQSRVRNEWTDTESRAGPRAGSGGSWRAAISAADRTCSSVLAACTSRRRGLAARLPWLPCSLPGYHCEVILLRLANSLETAFCSEARASVSGMICEIVCFSAFVRLI